MKSTPVLAAVTLLLAASPVLAQGTASQRAACTPDVWRLCSSAIPNVGAITACLRRESANLSPACRTVMNEVQGQTQQAAAAPAPERRAVERRVVERRAVERRVVAERPAARQRLAAAHPAPRMTERPVARRMSERPAPVRMTMRRSYARTVMVRRPAVAHHATHRRHYAGGGYGMPAGFAGLGGSRSAMRQANYWMRQVGGMVGGMGGMEGMGGMSLDSIRGMRVGDLMDMMQ
jgi:hypothetical protein